MESSKTQFVAPVTGDYKLECWGGGSHKPISTNKNAKSLDTNGGYSIGYYSMTSNDVIYAIIGGSGNANNNLVGGQGGFNGGGNGGQGYYYAGGSGGGGATHFSKNNCLLKSLQNNITAILLIAGGAGGSAINGQFDGYGGGVNGGSTHTAGWPELSVSPIFLEGASQTEGYAFGIGQDAGTKIDGSAGAEGNGGGGGGYYGGYAYIGEGAGSCCCGSGGSGYIGKDVSNGKTTSNVVSPSGNLDGYACISWFLK